MGYTAQIRLKKRGQVIHNEVETFDRRQHAVEWLRRRESELDALRARGELAGSRITLQELIQWYRETVGPVAKWGRSKEADLKRLAGYPIAKKLVASLTSEDYIQHVHARLQDGAGTATVGNDLIWIGQVLRSGRVSVCPGARVDLLMNARHELVSRRMITKSRWRDRRLSAAEEQALVEHFQRREARPQNRIPMRDIMAFALATARREDEITRICRSDLDRSTGTAWVNDVKHPTQKIGNRRQFRMLPEAWEIADRQPEQGDLLFPYNSKSIGSAFTKACKMLRGLLCGDGQWRQIVTVMDALAGGCTLFDIEQLRMEYSAEEFAQLLMCQFIDDTASVFPFDLVRRCMVDSWDVWDDFRDYAPRPLGNAPVSIGFDPSKGTGKGDPSGCTVNALPELPRDAWRTVEAHQWQGQDFSAQAANIKALTERYNVVDIGIDTTGMGTGVHELVKQFFPQARALQYNPELKGRMIMKAQDVMGKGRYEFDAGRTDLAAAWMGIRKTMTASGRHVTYEASRSEDVGHADLAWSAMHSMIYEPLTGQAVHGANVMEIC